MENEVPVTLTAETAPAIRNSGNFVDNFREAYKLAAALAKSSLIPQQYHGKVEDCAIAIDMADRMGVSPLMVMQSLYVVKGKPSWSGQACMSFIKAQYKNAYPVYVGEKGTDSRGCFIKAVTNEGDTVEGTVVTLKMAKDEGWMSNKKWSTMPEQMLAYRAAAFFARVYCPETLMGIQVQGEVEDSEPCQNNAQKLTAAIMGDNSGLLEDK